MKRIIIDFIPHKEQRYDTCGDWQFERLGTSNSDVNTADPDYIESMTALVIRVSNTSDWRSSALVAVHELVEALLCKHRGVTTEQVDKFDIGWKPHSGYTEPGDDPECPCYNEHNMAEEIEETLCNWLNYSWEAHEMQVDELE